MYETARAGKGALAIYWLSSHTHTGVSLWAETWEDVKQDCAGKWIEPADKAKEKGLACTCMRVVYTTSAD